jgi:hypothetical protein
MTEATLLKIIHEIPASKRQELYDFTRFLADNYSSADGRERIAAFESENEMIDFINDIGKSVYVD